MQNQIRSVGNRADSAGKTVFVHVDPKTGRHEGRSFTINSERADGRDE